MAVWAFDKATDRSFRVSPGNIALQHSFYDFPNRDVGRKIEADLASIEGKAARAINQLVGQRSVKALNDDSQLALADFLTTLVFRTRSVREQVQELDRLIQKRLRELGADPVAPGRSNCVSVR